MQQKGTSPVERQVSCKVSNQMYSEGSEQELRNRLNHMAWGIRAVRGGRNSSRRDLAAE